MNVGDNGGYWEWREGSAERAEDGGFAPGNASLGERRELLVPHPGGCEQGAQPTLRSHPGLPPALGP